jgi:hypothetical protein
MTGIFTGTILPPRKPPADADPADLLTAATLELQNHDAAVRIFCFAYSVLHFRNYICVGRRGAM